MPTNTWICPHCRDKDEMPLEFKEFEVWKEHMKQHKTPPKKKEPVKSPLSGSQTPEKVGLPKTETEPIRLVYKYEGKCSNCGVAVDTIELDIDKRTNDYYQVAWCPACKKKIKQRLVAKL